MTDVCPTRAAPETPETPEAESLISVNRSVTARDEANGTWTVTNLSEVRGSGVYRGIPVAGILYDNTTVVVRDAFV